MKHARAAALASTLGLAAATLALTPSAYADMDAPAVPASHLAACQAAGVPDEGELREMLSLGRQSVGGTSLELASAIYAWVGESEVATCLVSELVGDLPEGDLRYSSRVDLTALVGSESDGLVAENIVFRGPEQSGTLTPTSGRVVSTYVLGSSSTYAITDDVVAQDPEALAPFAGQEAGLLSDPGTGLLLEPMRLSWDVTLDRRAEQPVVVRASTEEVAAATTARDAAVAASQQVRDAAVAGAAATRDSQVASATESLETMKARAKKAGKQLRKAKAAKKADRNRRTVGKVRKARAAFKLRQARASKRALRVQAVHARYAAAVAAAEVAHAQRAQQAREDYHRAVQPKDSSVSVVVGSTTVSGSFGGGVA